jgi:hypothetical protein
VATESVHDTICRLSHPSFLRLLCCYHYEGQAFLVWEPVELSLAQVIGSKYAIREAELVSIVWPVSFEFPPSCLETLVLLAPQLTTFQIIQGIRYLRDSNRALASLTYESIFLTDSGSVRISRCHSTCWNSFYLGMGLVLMSDRSLHLSGRGTQLRNPRSRHEC